jgi:hypothetical protein
MTVTTRHFTQTMGPSQGTCPNGQLDTTMSYPVSEDVKAAIRDFIFTHMNAFYCDVVGSWTPNVLSNDEKESLRKNKADAVIADLEAHPVKLQQNIRIKYQVRGEHELKETVFQHRLFLDKESIELGNALYQKFAESGLSVQQVLPLVDGSVYASFGEGRVACISNYVAGKIFTSTPENAESLGKTVGQIRTVADSLDANDPLVAQIKSFTDETTMMAWKSGYAALNGVTGNSKIDAVMDVLNTLDLENAPRRVNQFLFIPRTALVKDDGTIHMTSLKAACRGYVPDMTSNFTYDSAIAAYRCVMNADQKMTTPGNPSDAEVIKNLAAFIKGYEQTTGLQNLDMSELFQAMKVANALNVALVGHFQAQKATQDFGFDIEGHLNRFMGHFNLIEGVERTWREMQATPVPPVFSNLPDSTPD